MKLPITRWRREWPGTRFVIRADSGFCRRRLMSWCDRNSVDCIIGLLGTPRLTRLVAPETAEAERAFTASGRKQFHFTERLYGAESWNRERRVIARIRHGPGGARPRFIVTSLKGECEALYRKVCCQRGEMENRIKEKQLQLFADRTSCHEWWPNRFRLLLAGLACTLINDIRCIALTGTRMARAQCATIRLKLPKIGAVITRNTRRIRLHLSGACPDQALFRLAAGRLKPGWQTPRRRHHDSGTMRAPRHRESRTKSARPPRISDRGSPEAPYAPRSHPLRARPPAMPDPAASAVRQSRRHPLEADAGGRTDPCDHGIAPGDHPVSARLTRQRRRARLRGATGCCA